MNLVFSILLFLASLTLIRSRCGSRAFATIASCATFLFCVLSGLYVVTNHFTGEGINESVIFHLRFGLEGAGFGDYTAWIVGGISYFLLTTAFAVALHRALIRNSPGKITVQVAAVLCMITAIAMNPANRNLMALYAQADDQTPGNIQEFKRYFHTPRVSRHSELKNLVFIYLESLESTYLNQETFPGLTPNLNALAGSARHFTNITQSYGTGWTIAGMVASQCGTPPFLPSPEVEISLEAERYLAGADCMGDIMKNAGYQLDYLGGASLEFAEKGNFYKTHGFANVQGKEELLPLIRQPDYFSDWGLYDDSLLQIARKRFQRLSRNRRPFGLFMLTLDTHHNGHESDYCEGIRYADGKNPILNAVHCADQMVHEFIEALQSSPDFGNTVIVVASDHLAMRNSVSERLAAAERKNLFLIIEPSVTNTARVDRLGSIMDIGPTVLSRIGLQTPGLGFGRDLLADTPSLKEVFQDFDGFLLRQRSHIASMWHD